LKKNNLEKSNVDHFIFHQASLMTLESVLKLLRISKSKAYINIYNKGNTVSASIPIALKDAIDQNIIDIGSRIVLSGFGVGLSYGAILMEL
jgi:3-oxoacyl-[acyl-carrier-protein] synthase-3